MSIMFIIIIGSTSVGLMRFHIHAKSIESVIDLTASFRSEDRHEISDDSGFGDAIGDRREYEMMLSVLRYVFLFPFSSLL